MARSNASIFDWFLTGLGSLARSILIARKFDRQGDIEAIRRLSWQQLEMIVGDAFRRRGYSVVENGGADGGIDLVLRKGDEEFLVQCKQWKAASVGVRPIREFLGVMTSRSAAGGFFLSSGKYTREARDFAVQTGIELLDGPALEQMVKEAQNPGPYLEPTIRQRRSTTRWPDAPVAPACPDCGSEMVERTSKRGSGAGSKFWGCKTWPRCRGTRPG